MGIEQGLGEEELGLNQENSSENTEKLTIGQRVSFVEGESINGDGNPVTKFGTIEDIKRDTASVKIDGTSMVVQVAKAEIQDASEK